MKFIRRFFQKRKLQYEHGKLYAPVSGAYIPLEDIPDATFAEGILGKGVGIEPDKGIVMSPAEGVVTVVANTYHAIGITTDDGIELLIHIGLDTVKMQGDGFLCYVEQGQSVKFGQKLLSFNISKIHEAGYPATVMFTVANSDQLEQIKFDVSGTIHCLEPIGMYSNG
ncbi:MAG: PTS glucose transporter subunit IIA [Anaerolineaceae bacterium]|nr:PTS glucose transporter subunit IIA [Anaerolineaceae bacterium]